MCSKMRLWWKNLTGWNDVVPLEDAGRGQVVDDVLQADVSEDGGERRALLCAKERLILSQLCRRSHAVKQKPIADSKIYK